MILKRFGHIILSLSLGLAGISCDGDRIADTPAPIPADKMVNLTFSVVAPDAVRQSESRALVITPDKDNYFQREAYKYERIHTLRIIILRPATKNGKPVTDAEGRPVTDPDGNPYSGKIVECNRLFLFNDKGVVRYDDLNIEVFGGENKTIYLLANEAGINANATAEAATVDFSTLSPGQPYTDGTIENIIIPTRTDGLLYDNREESSRKTYIPMSEVYDDVYVESPDSPELLNQKIGPFFITRAAVKFTFNVKASDAEGIDLKSVTFNRLANQEFFIPNSTVYHPAKPTFGKDDGDPTGGIANPNLPDYPEIDPDLSGRFITAYEIPANTTDAPFVFTLSRPLKLTNTYQAISLPVYFCESKVSPFGHDDKPYSVVFTIATKLGEQTIETTTPSLSLDNLPILPRNTHVKVNIDIGKYEAVVELVPYTGVMLTPDFGVDRE